MFYLFARCAIRLDGFVKQRSLFFSYYIEQRWTSYRDNNNNIPDRDLSSRQLVTKIELCERSPPRNSNAFTYRLLWLEFFKKKMKLDNLNKCEHHMPLGTSFIMVLPGRIAKFHRTRVWTNASQMKVGRTKSNDVKICV